MIRKKSYLRSVKASDLRVNIFENKINIIDVFRSKEMGIIFNYLKPYLKGIVFLIIITLGLSFLEGLKTLSILVFIKSLFLESLDSLNRIRIFGREILTLIKLQNKNILAFSIFTIFILLSILNVFIKYTISILTRRFQMTLVRDLRKDLYNKIVSFDIDFFNEAKSGELLFVMDAEASRFSNVMLHFKNLLSSLSTLLIFLVILFYMLPPITLAIVLLGALFLYLHQKIQRKLYISAWKANAYQFTLQQLFYEIVYGIKLIKLGRLENREREEYINRHLEFEKEDMRTVKLKTASDAAREGFFIFILTLFSTLFFYFIRNDILLKDSSFVLGYMVVLLRTLPCFSDFQRSVLGIIEAYAPLTKIIDILTKAIEEKKPLKEESYTSVGSLERVEIDELHFSYKGKNNVLRGVDTEFCKGKLYAIVSFSGGGKSTLLDLMANIRNPSKGRILFNDLEINDIDPTILMEKIGYMNQEPLIFHDTIKENIIFFKKEATSQEIDNALNMAAVKDFVYSLPEGLNTGLGERGLTISGGERQRIGLARVFLKDSEALLLDEATNSLDYKTEKIIYDNLRRIKEHKIIIVAAHRLSSIVDFDKIIVLYNGRVEEEGTHGELMKRGGIYHSLFKLQEIKGEAKF